MSIQIRKAKAIDAADLTELIRGLGLFQWTATESQSAIEKRVSSHLSLCLQDDSSHSIFLAHAPGGTLLGYGAVHWLPYLIFAGPEGFISELFVQEESRGQGVGTMLLEAAKAEAIQRSCVRLMLLNLRDRESYHRGFYLKCGWEERGVAANFVFRFPTQSPD
jgi:GNAT superfamily N-acetyltransferase